MESSSAQKPFPGDPHPLTLMLTPHPLLNHPRPKWPVLPFSLGPLRWEKTFPSAEGCVPHRVCPICAVTCAVTWGADWG